MYTASMDSPHPHHRAHQSFNASRGRSFGPLDSAIDWRQQSTPRGIASHPITSPIWTPQPGEARMLQQQQQQQQQQHHHHHHHQQQPSMSTNYTSEPPSPAQINILNSWGSQSAVKYAYYLDRGNGFVTRLIPADVLPPLTEIPPQEAKHTGMEVLQPLRGSPPNGVQDTNQRVTVKNVGRSSKRDKLYCDKWVHEGICAFEQQGCRYLHDMPSDKPTQISLGLFQGYPAWWRKHQSDVQRQRVELATIQQVDNKQQQQQQQQQNQHQQQQLVNYGMSAGQRAILPSARDVLADSEPDTPKNKNWRRDGMVVADAQINRRGVRPWSTDATGYQYPLGAIEPPNQRRR